jgi:cytochrome c
MRIVRVLLFTVFAIGTVILSACGGSSASAPAGPDIPATLSAKGDAKKGEVAFTAQGCNGCHALTSEKLVGPGLAGIFSANGPKLPDGVDYKGKLSNGQDRTDENVAAWIRSGGEGKIGLMAPHEISDTDMADLLAYLRTLK